MLLPASLLPSANPPQNAGPLAELFGRILGAFATWKDNPPPLPLSGIDPKSLEELLGEGEVEAWLDDGSLRIVESRYPGLWKCLWEGESDPSSLVVAAFPPELLAGMKQRPATEIAVGDAPEGLMNALPVLHELLAKAGELAAGGAPHSVNLGLMPMSHEDTIFIEGLLGLGGLSIVSRGYGQCRIVATRVAGVWRTQFFNVEDKPIAAIIDVCALPDAAAATAEDMEDSRERLADTLAWLRGE